MGELKMKTVNLNVMFFIVLQWIWILQSLEGPKKANTLLMTLKYNIVYTCIFLNFNFKAVTMIKLINLSSQNTKTSK